MPSSTPAMREPTLLVMSALAAGPRHGYALLQDIEQLSDGAVTLRPGTLYAALERLTEEGLVEMVREEVVEGRHRRLYDLTPAGVDGLRTETRRLRARADQAEKGLRARGVRLAFQPVGPAMNSVGVH